MEQFGELDFHKLKSTYPLKDNPNLASFTYLRNNSQDTPNMTNLSKHEHSAFQDESMLQDRLLIKDDLGPDMSIIESAADISIKHINEGKFSMDEMAIQDKHKQMEKARFKESDDKFDLLKDIRKNKNEKKKTKKEEVKEGEEGEVGGESTGEANEDEEEKFMEEDTGSVASSTKSLMKHLRMLRNALYENYAPPSIRHLKLFAYVVFRALLCLTVFWYWYARITYSHLYDNIQNIYSSKNRMNGLTEIGSDVRSLWAMGQGLIELERGGMDYKLELQTGLNLTGAILQESQNNLSTTYLRNIFTDESNQLINPT